MAICWSSRPLEKTHRGSRPVSDEYEALRVAEIGARTELYKLRIARLRGEVLDRQRVAEEFSAIASRRVGWNG